MLRLGLKMTKRLVIMVTVGLLLFLLGCPAAPGTPDLIAENNTFNEDSLRVRSGEEVTMVFENRDNTTHNFALYRDRDATEVIFRGEALPGPGTITYTFTAPELPAYYYFQCDFHPEVMNGFLTVGGTSS